MSAYGELYAVSETEIESCGVTYSRSYCGDVVAEFDRKIALIMAIAFLSATNQINAFDPEQTYSLDDELWLDGNTSHGASIGSLRNNFEFFNGRK